MSAGAAFSRRRRALLTSVIVVVVLSFGSLAATILAGWSPRLGLDLAGGTEIVLVPAKNHHATQADLNLAVQIIRNRVDGIGVSGATVNVQGSQVVVQVPGVNNGRKLDQEIGQTAQLYFRPVLCGAYPYQKPAKGVKPKSAFNVPACGAAYQTTAANLDVIPDSSISAGYTSRTPQPDPVFTDIPSVNGLNDPANQTVVESELPDAGVYDRYVLGPAAMKGEVVTGASVEQTTLGQWVVNCNLSARGSTLWDTIANRYFHAFIAIELDGVVQSAPIILPTQSTFTSFMGQISIQGDLTQSQANTIAQALNFGSLPVPFVPLTTETVSPTLGHASLVAGLGAGIAGLILVLLYVVFYYRLLGAVVLAGLGITAAILWALISALGHTSVAPSFDLAGVTGVIVSIGITVDSYVVYFERLKDETRAGRSVRTSLDRSFASAWRTVLAADTVSFLAAVLLYFLAVGSVQGFAFFLGLSTLLDVFVTWFFTRPVVGLLGRSEALTGMRRLGIARGLAVAQGAPA